MDKDPLEELDYPLLVTLSSLLETGSVTASARALARSQSSVSRTLARLRLLFDDPLLVPVGRGLRLSHRASELRPAVTRALEDLRRLFEPQRPLDLRSSRRALRIAASDYASVAILNGWMADLRCIAPGIVVQVSPVDASSVEPLARGDLDLAVAPFLAGVGLEQFVARSLLRDRHVCVLRAGHPAADKPLGLHEYLALEHIRVASVLPAVSSVDEALHKLRATRRVAARVPSVLSALSLAAISDLASTTLTRAVSCFGDRLVARPLPFEVPHVELCLLWHPRDSTDPLHRWLREDLLARAASL